MSAYRVAYSVACGPPELLTEGIVAVEVRSDGAIVVEGTPPAQVLTIDEIYNLIDEYGGKGVAFVEYDEGLWFPTQVELRGDITICINVWDVEHLPTTQP